MTQEETRSPDLRGSAACRDDLLVLCGGAGVCNASLITIMASADAFAARLAASSQHAAELSTLPERRPFDGHRLPKCGSSPAPGLHLRPGSDQPGGDAGL